MPMWYGKRLPIFSEISEESRIEVVRVPASATTPPCLKLSQKVVANDAVVLEKAKMEYIRLSLPVKCNRNFIRKYAVFCFYIELKFNILEIKI